VRKRVITAAVGVAGLVVVGLGVASATAWRADDVLVASTTASSHVVVTDPGVLELGGDPATVRVTSADGAEVVVVVGRDTDVLGWVGSDVYTRVTGLSSWRELATVAGEPAPGAGTTSPTAGPAPSAASTPTAASSPTAPATASPTGTATSAQAPSPTATAVAPDAAEPTPTQASPAGNDNWVAQAIGEDGTAELVWPAQSGRWSLLAVSRGAAEPTLQISWPRVVTTPWLWPCVVAGSLLVLVAGGLLLREWQGGRPGTWEPVHSGAVPVVDESRPLTRRELRAAAQAAAGRPPTGSVARVTGPQSTVEVPAEGRHSSPGSAGGPDTGDTRHLVGRVVARTSPESTVPESTAHPSAAPTGAGTAPGRGTVVGAPTPSSAEQLTGRRSAASPALGASGVPVTPDRAPASTSPDPHRAPSLPAPGRPVAGQPTGDPVQGAPRPTSRRALRQEGATAAVPTVPGPQQTGAPAAGPAAHVGTAHVGTAAAGPRQTWDPASGSPRPPADRPSSADPGRPGSSWAPRVGPTSAAPAGRPQPDATAFAAEAATSAGAATGAGARDASHAAGRGDDRRSVASGPVSSSPMSSAPASPHPVSSGAAPSGPGVPGAADQAGGPHVPSWGRPTAPAGHARPSWLAGRPVEAPSRPASPTGSPSLPSPGGWVPASPADAAGTAAGRPAWTAGPSGSTAGTAAPQDRPGAGGQPDPTTGVDSAGSRADAWRRAWGLPPSAESAATNDDPDTPATQGGEER